jgi:hypothetical protein
VSQCLGREAGAVSREIDKQARQRNERGVKLAEKGNCAASLRELHGAFNLHPDCAGARYNFGMSFYQIHNLEGALGLSAPRREVWVIQSTGEEE